MDLVQASSAKATWPHDKLTTDNIVDNGLSWFEQMSSIMGNYLTGSSCHVFGQGNNDWGPFHQTIHWRSPVTYARHALRDEVQGVLDDPNHDDYITVQDIEPTNIDFEDITLDDEARQWLQERATKYMRDYANLYKPMRTATLILKHNKSQDELKLWMTPNVLNTYWLQCEQYARSLVQTGVSPELLKLAKEALQESRATFLGLDVKMAGPTSAYTLTAALFHLYRTKARLALGGNEAQYRSGTPMIGNTHTALDVTTTNQLTWIEAFFAL